MPSPSSFRVCNVSPHSVHARVPDPANKWELVFSRRPWYQRVMDVIILWKPAAKPPLAKSCGVAAGSPSKPKLKRCTSVKVASSFRVCLCAPISSYNEPFHADAGPRRSHGYPKPKPLTAAKPERVVMSTRASMEGRRLFRGKSLTDDIVMRRFVLEEEAAMMQLKRRNQMEFMRKRNALRRKKLGPSPLSRMTMAEEE